MKIPILALTLAPLAALAVERPLHWTSDISRVADMRFDAMHGDALDFKVDFNALGKPVDLSGLDATLYWQTNGMGSAWWSAPGAISNSTARALFPSSADPGDKTLNFYLALSGGSNVVYGASARVTFRNSPGLSPNMIAPPIVTIDFNTIEVLNAPYYDKAETEEQIDSAINGLSTVAHTGSYNDLSDTPTIPTVPTAVSAFANDAGYLTEHQTIPDETDPTVHDWAKAAAKPGYTASEVGVSLASGLDSLESTYHQLTVDGESIRVYGWAQQQNKPVYTASELGAATAASVDAVVRQVATLESWAIGDDTAIKVENAGETNAVFSITYTNKTMYSSAAAETNTLAKARGYTDAAVESALDIIDAAKADKSWGQYNSDGSAASAEQLEIRKARVALTGGGNYSFVETSTGGYWVMAVSLGSVWTLEALADAQNPTNASTIVLYDADGNAAMTVTSTSSREVYAVDGEQYIRVATVGGNDVVTISYPVVADSAPTLLFSPEPAPLEDCKTYDYWPTNIVSVVASGQTGMWTNTVTMAGAPGKGFFRAKYVKNGSTYTTFSRPVGFHEIVIDGTTYTGHVETINGRKHLILEDL